MKPRMFLFLSQLYLTCFYEKLKLHETISFWFSLILASTQKETWNHPKLNFATDIKFRSFNRVSTYIFFAGGKSLLRVVRIAANADCQILKRSKDFKLILDRLHFVFLYCSPNKNKLIQWNYWATESLNVRNLVFR